MILITGSEGLIGKTLIELLHSKGIEYLGFDNALSESDPSYGDVCDPLSSQVDLDAIEGVIHLAAVSRVVWGQENPELCWLSNTMGTSNILKSICSEKYKDKIWMIYASSREIYGQQGQLPVNEDAVPKPMNHYAFSKFSAESLVKLYQLQGYRAQILRFSSVYGRTDDHIDRVVPAFCSAAVTGSPIRIDGRNNVLDFTFVEDVAEGIFQTITALKEKRSLPSAIHFTSGIPTTLEELAKSVIQISGNNCELIDAPPRNYDVSRFCGDPSLAWKTLDWKATTSLGEGLSKLIHDFKKILL